MYPHSDFSQPDGARPPHWRDASQNIYDWSVTRWQNLVSRSHVMRYEIFRPRHELELFQAWVELSHKTSHLSDSGRDMEELLAKHRLEKKDLQGRITQRKKAATKKTRRGVNDECERLEQELQERHEAEIAALNGELAADGADDIGNVLNGQVQETDEHNQYTNLENGENTLESDMSKLSVSSVPGKKPNRQKARLARRAAEQARIAEEAALEASQIPDHRELERQAMMEAFKERGLEEKVVRADGHCLYAAVADQLHVRGDSVHVERVSVIGDDYRIVRHVAADQIATHSDDYIPFLDEDLDSYLTKVRDTGEWGGHLELLALSKAYKSKICVLQGDGSVTDIGEGPDDKTMWLAFYRHNFGLGEHYNSLRKVGRKEP